MNGRGAAVVGCLTSLACAAVTAAPARAALIGRVVHVGFPGVVGDVVRPGAWTPVVVDLTLEGANSFDGFLRVSQRDKDGDLAYDRISVQLRADAGARRTYVLYCLTGPPGGDAGILAVDVLDESGSVVEVISEDSRMPVRSLKPAQNPEPLAPEEYLILSLSDGGIGKVAYLEGLDQRDKFDRPVRVAHLKPAELPGRWQALEMADAIVWEAADATELTAAQLDALILWVRQGGQLLMAASRTADTIARSKHLADVLPVRIGKVESHRRLAGLRYQLLGGAQYREDEPPPSGKPPFFYAHRFPLAMCQTAPGADTLVREKELGTTVVAQRRVDRGRVVFVAAELRHLLGEEGLNPIKFFKSLLWLRGADAGVDALPTPTPLFPLLEQTVGFRRSTGVYLLAAVLFSIAYVGIATFGSWSFLRSRGWTQYAWSSFAVVAGVASVLSFFAVQAMRGVGQSLQQLTVVDAVAGETAATATAYFGIKTGLDTALDVWMPSDYTQAAEPERTDCYLKPLPSSAAEFSSASSFVDPRRYRLVPASALLEDVPVRATLKQFEGRWIGHLRRTLEADVRVGEIEDDTAVELGILDGSTITNNLGHALQNCVLIQPLKNAFIGRTFVENTPRGSGERQILVHPVGYIADGERIDLADRIYTDPARVERLTVEEWLGHTLGENHKNWGKKFVSSNPFAGGSDVVRRFRTQDYQDALLMLTALSENYPPNLPGTYGAGYDFSRRNCGHLDRSDELTTDRFLLIGFVDEQGPVMLCTRSGGGRFRPLLADEAHTMYRFWIPVTRM